MITAVPNQESESEEVGVGVSAVAEMSSRSMMSHRHQRNIIIHLHLLESFAPPYDKQKLLHMTLTIDMQIPTQMSTAIDMVTRSRIRVAVRITIPVLPATTATS